MIAQQIIILAACMVLCSCAALTRQEYSRPKLDLPQQWQQGKSDGSSVAAGKQWWHSFNDPQLSSLIEKVLTRNNDLAAATLKARRAWLKSRLTDTNLTPGVTASADSSYSRNLNSGADNRNQSISGSLSYELDLWGKLAIARDAARWEAEATDMDRDSTALSLIGTTAAAYWQVAYLNQRIALAQSSLDYAKKTLDIVRSKQTSGAIGALDVIQADQKLAAQRASLALLIQQRVEARNTLALLFDQSPQAMSAERQEIATATLPAIQPGLPAQLLARRPDLMAAERRLRKCLAEGDVTRLGYYPTLTLTGSLGSSSSSLANLIQNPAATLGAGLVLPFLQINTTRLNIQISQNEYAEAVVNFRQTMYSAFRDVENALSANSQYQAEGVELERSLELARQAERISGERYRAGAVAMQVWLDAQETRRSAEVSWLQNRLNRLKNMMTLYQALGGDGT